MDLKSQIQKRMAAQALFAVSTPTFLDIGSRGAIDPALSRMTSAGEIRRITRGLYDLPRPNSLTGSRPTRSTPGVSNAPRRAILRSASTACGMLAC